MSWRRQKGVFKGIVYGRGGVVFDPRSYLVQLLVSPIMIVTTEKSRENVPVVYESSKTSSRSNKVRSEFNDKRCFNNQTGSDYIR